MRLFKNKHFVTACFGFAFIMMGYIVRSSDDLPRWHVAAGGLVMAVGIFFVAGMVYNIIIGK